MELECLAHRQSKGLVELKTCLKSKWVWFLACKALSLEDAQDVFLTEKLHSLSLDDAGAGKGCSSQRALVDAGAQDGELLLENGFCSVLSVAREQRNAFADGLVDHLGRPRCF